MNVEMEKELWEDGLMRAKFPRRAKFTQSSLSGGAVNSVRCCAMWGIHDFRNIRKHKVSPQVCIRLTPTLMLTVFKLNE